MLDTEFVKYLSTMGVGGIIAGIMFLVYRKDMKENADKWKGQADALLGVVQANTAAITNLTKSMEQNTRTIEALHAREDQVQVWLERLGVSFDRNGRKTDG